MCWIFFDMFNAYFPCFMLHAEHCWASGQKHTTSATENDEACAYHSMAEEGRCYGRVRPGISPTRAGSGPRCMWCFAFSVTT